ncbi:unnamed protein product [Gadus morhua 'NCC']
MMGGGGLSGGRVVGGVCGRGLRGALSRRNSTTDDDDDEDEERFSSSSCLVLPQMPSRSGIWTGLLALCPSTECPQEDLLPGWWWGVGGVSSVSLYQRLFAVALDITAHSDVFLVNYKEIFEKMSGGSEMGDEGCFKSVLPPQVLDDSSLALPAEHSILSPARFHSVDRSVRVQQQVQLTLARKGKRSASNAHSQHAPTEWSGFWPNSPPRERRVFSDRPSRAGPVVENAFGRLPVFSITSCGGQPPQVH